MFTLHPRLAADTFFIADKPLCSVLLMNNQNFPWLILVPRIEGTREIIDLTKSGQHRLTDEIAEASRVLRQLFSPFKLNVAALGNQVPQLHVHVIARNENDPAWPNPVWGTKPITYTDPKPVLGRFQDAFSDT